MLFCEHRARLENDGYCVIHPVDAGNLLDFGSALGRLQLDLRDGVLVKDIRPQPKHIANTNTLSSRYGMGAFPVHTEAAYLHKPPRFLLLYCIEPGRGGRTTVLLDGKALSSRLPDVRRPGTWGWSRRAVRRSCATSSGAGRGTRSALGTTASASSRAALQH